MIELFVPKIWQGESLTVDPLGKLSAKNVETAALRKQKGTFPYFL